MPILELEGTNQRTKNRGAYMNDASAELTASLRSTISDSPRSRLLALHRESTPQVNRFRGLYSSTRTRQRQAASLSRRMTGLLRALAATGAGMCVAMVAVLHRGTECGALWCSAATFGGRSGLTIAGAAIGTLGLLVAAIRTRGFTRRAWLVWPAAVLTALSVAGVVVVVAVALLTVAAAAFGVGLVCAVINERS